MNNPVIQRMMKQFFQDQFKHLQETGDVNITRTQEQTQQSSERPISSVDKGKVAANRHEGRLNMNFNERAEDRPRVNTKRCDKITSPSDTTIYAPALQRKLTPNNEGLSLNIQEEGNIGRPRPSNLQQDLNSITNFVETV